MHVPRIFASVCNMPQPQPTETMSTWETINYLGGGSGWHRDVDGFGRLSVSSDGFAHGFGGECDVDEIKWCFGSSSHHTPERAKELAEACAGARPLAEAQPGWIEGEAWPKLLPSFSRHHGGMILRVNAWRSLIYPQRQAGPRGSCGIYDEYQPREGEEIAMLWRFWVEFPHSSATCIDWRVKSWAAWRTHEQAMCMADAVAKGLLDAGLTPAEAGAWRVSPVSFTEGAGPL